MQPIQHNTLPWHEQAVANHWATERRLHESAEANRIVDRWNVMAEITERERLRHLKEEQEAARAAQRSMERKPFPLLGYKLSKPSSCGRGLIFGVLLGLWLGS